MTTAALREPLTAPGLPVLGSLVDFRRRQLDMQVRAMNSLGDVVRFQAGPPGLRVSMYSVYSPEGVHHVLAHESARYRKDNQFYEEMREAFGEGLVVSQDATWARQKRFVQPLFTHAQVHGYLPAIVTEVDALVERWSAAARTGTEVDLHEAMTQLTLRVVGRALFGEDVEKAHSVVRRTMAVLGDRVQRRGFAPVRVPSGWPTPANRRAERAHGELDALVERLITARRRSGARHEDLLGRLLAARDGAPSGGAARLGDAEARDQLLVFLFAGHDTTATTLTAALHLLGSHPAVQQQAAAEARDVLAGGHPTAADLRRLPCLTAVIKEALRLYPPAFATGRRLTGGDDVVGGYRIPDGSDVGVLPWATHRHPRHWDAPERFDPQRFTPEREAARHHYAWFPFGGGPRTCIGSHFAVVESLVALAAVLQTFRVETPQRPLGVVPALTLRPVGPVPARLTPR